MLSSAILAAIATDAPLRIVYTDADGVTSLRTIRPRSVERCRVNRETIIRAHDCNRNAPRSFRLDRLENAGVVA